MKSALLLFTALFFSCLVHAQEPEAQPTPYPLPKGPLLARAPEFSQWVIYFNPQKKKAAALASATPPPGGPAEVKQITVTKTRTIYHEETLDTLGRKRESWRVGPLQIVTLPGTKTWTILDPSSFGAGGADPTLYTDYSKTDFPGLEWVSAKNYVDVKKVMGLDCIVCKSGAAPAAPPQSQASLSPAADAGRNAPEMTACMDLTTRLPVVFLRGEETRVYQFVDLAPVMQTLPPEIQTALLQRAKSIQQMIRRPAKPAKTP